ncbi:polyphosphate kinase [Psychrobacillus sp. NPDC093180]|uniref:polyphosphate kinase n=1 Tax=Psychrobacillus sp. NPDC093180 TaxID=3364489 RepID=UPI003823D7A9
MDKYLKELNFEEKINTSFTEENKQSVLIKINEIEKTGKPKQYYFQHVLTLAFTAGLVIFGYTFISNNIEGINENAGEPNIIEKGLTQNQNEEESIEILGMEEDEDKKKEKLKAGVYRPNGNPESDLIWDHEKRESIPYDYSNSNYNLYVAHLRAAMITDNGLYIRHRTMPNTTFIRYLESILFYLNEIEPGEEKNDELQMAIQLAEQALNNNVEKGDPTLDELHMILHELDEYFNKNPFEDSVETEFGVKIKE